MQLIKITVFWLGTIIQFSDAQKTSDLNAEVDDPVILSCNLTGSYEYPLWKGPPSLASYTVEGLNQINPSAQAGNRLTYATNKQDLVLEPAFKNDSGVYQCSFTSLGDHTITLQVLEKTTTTTGSTSTPTSAANTTGSTTSPPNVTDSDGKKIIIGVSVGVVIAVVLAILIGVCCYFKYKNRARKQEHSENKVSYSNNQGQDGRFSNKSYETENKL